MKGKQKIAVNTLFFQGAKFVKLIGPNQCKPVRLAPGVYRVISEHRVSGGGQPISLTLQEAGLRLQGKEMIGDVTGLLSQPIVQKQG
jgi:hypothetical protein